jgi:hypothetical protein
VPRSPWYFADLGQFFPFGPSIMWSSSSSRNPVAFARRMSNKMCWGQFGKMRPSARGLGTWAPEGKTN